MASGSWLILLVIGSLATIAILGDPRRSVRNAPSPFTRRLSRAEDATSRDPLDYIAGRDEHP